MEFTLSLEFNFSSQHVNSAFLSWESARRVKEGLPDLRDIPACIGGDPKKRTGIVVAKSIPAKKFGIQTGAPLRLIGVALTNLTDESFEQLSLFEDNEKKERRRKLDATMDEIRKKFDNDKITRASIMNSSTGIAKKARAQMKNEDDKESGTVE